MAINPILTGERRNQYTSSGSLGPYNFTFVIFADTDLAVYVDSTKKTLTTHYTVSTNTNGTGSITFTSGNAPANAAIVTIIGNKDLARATVFSSGGPLTADSLETEFNNSLLFLQQLDEKISRCLTLPIETANTRPFALPDKSTRASKIMAFDANGNPETTVNSSGLDTLSGIATEIQALAAISSDITAVNSNSTNINNLAAQISAVTNVNSSLSAINTVNSNISAINTANSNSTAITNVSNAIPNINQVANNLSSVSNFANIYLGASSSAPTQDPDGSALDDGDLYFDTSTNTLRVYASGSGWQSAGSSINGTSARFTFTVSSSTTTITGNDDYGSNLAYDAGFVDVYLNGVRMVNASDVTVTSGTSIVFANPIGASGTDTVDVIAFGTFQVANIAASAITSGTLGVARGGTGKTTSDLSGQAGKVLVVNAAQNGFDIGQASTAEVYGFNTSFTASTVYYNVAVQSVGGANKYFIMGQQQKTLELEEGNTYIFDHPSAHPLRFSTDSNNSTPYTTGVTVVSSTRVQIVVAANAPTLYYYCNVHAGMGGQANTPAPVNNTLQVTTTNQGADNIDAATYAAFDDVIFAASGITFSLDNGDLIATI